MKNRKIFISLPDDRWLSEAENQLKWAIVEEIEKLGYTGEIFLDPRGTDSLSGSKSWSAAECENVMRRCEGCVLLGFPRFEFNNARFPTDYNHYEGAVARTLKLPMLVLIQEDVVRRVVFDSSFGGFVGTMPANPTLDWLKTSGFQTPFKYFQDNLKKRRDVFLGYCSTSSETAKNIKEYMTSELGISVLDWQTDFKPGRSILDQIQEASNNCGAGMFLFTKDDILSDTDKPDIAAPRDNVVFEAGFFIGLKGKSHNLIVRETGAKMPADLGGDIYASLTDKNDINSIKQTIKNFVEAL